ncbi:H-NS histone family protein [Aquincola sp. S2]|uniref:H-NS histone family protein n=1 Tax=Pseudaquabacterium terrae TaxID=2732868 RepID=A0ABX2E9H1_9BURK|nr:H-NS histone family protein [Aquabacterium terrae]NRF65631.1 H-NS histone family protein [Aquabacterium terrae]
MKKVETYGAVLAEIERLQQRAANLRKSELPGVIERIRDAIAAYGLTATDLGFGGGATSAGKAAATAAPKAPRAKRGARVAAPASKGTLTVGVAKYRDPKSGKTWTGRGKPPLWIVGAKDRTPFLIDGAAAAAPAAPAAEAAPAKKRGPKPGFKRGRKAAAAPAGRKRAGRKAGTPAESGDQATPAAA